MTPGKDTRQAKIASENESAAKKASDTFGYYNIDICHRLILCTPI